MELYHTIRSTILCMDTTRISSIGTPETVGGVMLQTLATLLITQQIVQQVMETVIPYFFYRLRKVNIVKRQRQETQDTGSLVSDRLKHQAEIESSKEEYEVEMRVCGLDCVRWRCGFVA